MSNSLLQSPNAVTTTRSASSVNVTSNFPSATTSGSLLIAICSASVAKSGAGITPSLNAPSTPGFTWTLASTLTNTTQYFDGFDYWEIVGAIYYIANASAMASSVVTTLTATTTTSSNSGLSPFLQLIEVSGPVILDTTAQASGSSGVPSAGSISASGNNEFILALEVDYQAGIAIGNGSGWTILSSSYFNEFILNAASGSHTATFSGSISYPWLAIATAFSSVSVTVTNVSPPSGYTTGGTPVTITGTGFGSGATVSFGGNAATSVVVVSSTEITCVTPAGTLGYVNVGVTDSSGTGTLTNGFQYVYPPVTVTGVVPPSGTTAGGTSVVVTGTGFLSGAVVDFGSNAATSVSVVSSTEITCLTPSGAAGYVTVSVTDTYGTGSLIDGYEYITPIPPETFNIFRYDGWISTPLGNSISQADVWVLQQPATVPSGYQVIYSSGQPVLSGSYPSPLAQVYSDPNGLVPLQQPLQPDAFGHYFFYALGHSSGATLSASNFYTVAVYKNRGSSFTGSKLSSLYYTLPDQYLGNTTT